VVSFTPLPLELREKSPRYPLGGPQKRASNPDPSVVQPIASRYSIYAIPAPTGKKWEHNEIVYEPFICFKKACYSFRREVLYSVLIEFYVPVKLIRLIKMCVNETYNEVRIGKSLSDKFPIQKGLKQGNAL
jgi:hypothetical protein